MATPEPAVTHRHTWTGVDFFVADDRPMMRQTCGCGAFRDVRAFDVTWDPARSTSPLRQGR